LSFVAAARHSPPPQPRSLRGFIVAVVIVVIFTAVTTVFPPLDCDLFDCRVCSFVMSSPRPHQVVAIPPTASAIVVVVVVVVVAVVVGIVIVVVIAYYPPLCMIYLIVVCMSLSLVMSSPCSPPAPPLRVVC